MHLYIWVRSQNRNVSSTVNEVLWGQVLYDRTFSYLWGASCSFLMLTMFLRILSINCHQQYSKWKICIYLWTLKSHFEGIQVRSDFFSLFASPLVNVSLHLVFLFLFFLFSFSCFFPVFKLHVFKTASS